MKFSVLILIILTNVLNAAETIVVRRRQFYFSTYFEMEFENQRFETVVKNRLQLWPEYHLYSAYGKLMARGITAFPFFKQPSMRIVLADGDEYGILKKLSETDRVQLYLWIDNLENNIYFFTVRDSVFLNRLSIYDHDWNTYGSILNRVFPSLPDCWIIQLVDSSLREEPLLPLIVIFFIETWGCA